jgi:hypothetical protein
MQILDTAMTLTHYKPIFELAQIDPPELNKDAVRRLSAQAVNIEDHLLIAGYYKEKAEDYLEHAYVHAAMVAGYRAGAIRVNGAGEADMLPYCESLVESCKELAAKAHEMAEIHEQMASGVSTQHLQAG